MHAVRSVGLQAFTSKARFDMHVRDGLRLAHRTAAARARMLHGVKDTACRPAGIWLRSPLGLQERSSIDVHTAHVVCFFRM